MYLLDSSQLQQHPTSSDQAPLDVLRFVVFLQHFLLLTCHCRLVLEHQSSSLGNVIEFPSSCTLLGSKRSIQLLHLTTQQASANKTCVATSVRLFSRSRLSCSFFQVNLWPSHTEPPGSAPALPFLHSGPPCWGTVSYFKKRTSGGTRWAEHHGAKRTLFFRRHCGLRTAAADRRVPDQSRV